MQLLTNFVRFSKGGVGAAQPPLLIGSDSANKGWLRFCKTADNIMYLIEKEGLADFPLLSY